MDQHLLRRFVAEPESATLDRKLECHAFQGNGRQNAELVKDICAMANNGNRLSYIVVGIADDLSELRSVRNAKLTDDNLQDLVKHTITPVPRVRLEDAEWTADGATTRLKVIVVGRNTRQAYALATDMIDHKQGYAFRRNEVWIRRRATSDLATPQEVHRLVEGHDLVTDAGPQVNRVYARVEARERVRVVYDDVAATDSRLAVYAPEKLALLGLRGETVAVRLLVNDAVKKPYPEHAWVNLMYAWAFEHAVLEVSLGPRSHKYVTERWNPIETSGFDLVSKEDWGWYCLADVAGSGEHPRSEHPIFTWSLGRTIRNGPPLRVPMFVLHGVIDTKGLAKRIRGLLSFLEEPEVADTVLAERANIVTAMQSMLRDGCAYLTPPAGGELSGRTAEQVRPPDIYLPERFGEHNVVRREDRETYLNAATFSLAMAEGAVQRELPPCRVLGEDLHADTPRGRAAPSTLSPLMENVRGLRRR